MADVVGQIHVQSKVLTLRTLKLCPELWSVSLLNRKCTKPLFFNSITYGILNVISYYNSHDRTVVVYLCLWDDAAEMFKGLINQVIEPSLSWWSVVTTVNPKIFGGLLYR